jgi:hypothetical protein
MKKSIKQDQKAIEEIANEFDNIHGTRTEIVNLFLLNISDMYVDIRDVIYCLEHNITFDIMRDWYDDLLNTEKRLPLQEFIQRSKK